ncbi:hypothetical protein [Nocardia cyriacigeorgica]|uniref:hypothetical protein n=1 Tax=Nocardia cyriacigeorgica TaxID=135487 RepID=UPI002454C473|nr:hypothetical protein [Nocardia cyriacigeorgica]
MDNAPNRENLSHAEVLASLGIKVTEPCGDVTSSGGWSTIGSLIATEHELAEVIPRHGLDATQYDMLVSTAAQIWIRGVGQDQCWRHHPDLGWVAGVRVRQPSRRFLRSARASMCASVSGAN